MNILKRIITKIKNDRKEKKKLKEAFDTMSIEECKEYFISLKAKMQEEENNEK